MYKGSSSYSRFKCKTIYIKISSYCIYTKFATEIEKILLKIRFELQYDVIYLRIYGIDLGIKKKVRKYRTNTQYIDLGLDEPPGMSQHGTRGIVPRWDTPDASVTDTRKKRLGESMLCYSQLSKEFC
jgi:hypothetical protein